MIYSWCLIDVEVTTFSWWETRRILTQSLPYNECHKGNSSHFPRLSCARWEIKEQHYSDHKVRLIPLVMHMTFGLHATGSDSVSYVYHLTASNGKNRIAHNLAVETNPARWIIPEFFHEKLTWRTVQLDSLQFFYCRSPCFKEYSVHYPD